MVFYIGKYPFRKRSLPFGRPSKMATIVCEMEISVYIAQLDSSSNWLATKIGPQCVQTYHSTKTKVNRIIVNRGDWFWSSADIKGTNKDAKIYVGKSMTVHNLLFCAHTLCMNYVTNTFLLVSSSVRSKQLLCFEHGQGQKREQKHTTKKFLRFHNHSPRLTMTELRKKHLPS